MAKFDGIETKKPVGIAWYRPEDWARIREISIDRAYLPEDFGEWERGMDRHLAELAIRGIEPDKFIIDPDALLAWATFRNIKIDNQARTRYATELLGGNSNKGPN